MKPAAALAAGLALAVAGAAGGYWFGQHPAQEHTAASAQTDGGKPAPKLLYYRNPMGLADTSPTPKKDPMGMEYIPVYEG